MCQFHMRLHKKIRLALVLYILVSHVQVDAVATIKLALIPTIIMHVQLHFRDNHGMVRMLCTCL